MRRIVLATAATLAILAAGSFVPNRAEAMTVTTPAGIQAALDDTNLLRTSPISVAGFGAADPTAAAGAADAGGLALPLLLRRAILHTAAGWRPRQSQRSSCRARDLANELRKAGREARTPWKTGPARFDALAFPRSGRRPAASLLDAGVGLYPDDRSRQRNHLGADDMSLRVRAERTLQRYRPGPSKCGPDQWTDRRPGVLLPPAWSPAPASTPPVIDLRLWLRMACQAVVDFMLQQEGARARSTGCEPPSNPAAKRLLVVNE